jgi:YesN/AraC family two-component response regulator
MPKIIIVDDEELARDYLKGMLLELSLPVAYEADNAQDALQAVMNYQPEILFLDIELPDTNGIEVLRQVKQARSECFVVMVSGHSTFKNLKNATDHGAASFIVKPYSRKKLENVINLYNQQIRPPKTA